MVTIPGLDSGNQAKFTPGIIDVSEPDITGEKIINNTESTKPPHIDQTAPRVLNPFQYRE